MQINFNFIFKRIFLFSFFIGALSFNALAEKQIAQHTINLGAADDVRYYTDNSGNLLTLNGFITNGTYTAVNFEIKNAKGSVVASGAIPELVGKSNVRAIKWKKKKAVLRWESDMGTNQHFANFVLSKKGVKLIGTTLSLPDTATLRQEGKNFFSFDDIAGFVYTKYTGLFKQIGTFTETGNQFRITRYGKNYIVRVRNPGPPETFTFKRYSSKFKQVGETFSAASDAGAPDLFEAGGKLIVVHFPSPSNTTYTLLSRTFKSKSTIAAGSDTGFNAPPGYEPPPEVIDLFNNLPAIFLPERKTAIYDNIFPDPTNVVVNIKTF